MPESNDKKPAKKKKKWKTGKRKSKTRVWKVRWVNAKGNKKSSKS